MGRPDLSMEMQAVLMVLDCELLRRVFQRKTYLHVNIDISDSSGTEDIAQSVNAKKLTILVPWVIDQREELMHVGPSTSSDTVAT